MHNYDASVYSIAAIGNHMRMLLPCVKLPNLNSRFLKFCALQEAIQEMKQWLKETGSPSCRIQKVQFSHELTLQKRTYDSFTIRR